LSYTDPPDALLDYAHWQLQRADGIVQDCELRDAECDGRGLRIALVGIDDRNAAELLRGCEITVPRAELPPAGPREYYQDDLVGFAVRNAEGTALGTVKYFVDGPAQPLMVVAGDKEHWIPAAPPHLRRVDLERRELVVEWPEEL